MAKSRSYIYLEGTEELGDILEIISKTKDDEIILVVPKNFKVLKHPKNLEIFQREVERLKKEVFLDSEDKEFINLASNLGLNIFLKDFALEEPKIIDVKPPKSKILEKESITSSVKVSYQTPKPLFRIHLNFGLFKKLGLFLGFSIFIYFLFTFLFGLIQTRAVISMVLERKTEDFNEIITLKENLVQIDYQNKILPAKKIVIEKATSEEIETTGLTTEGGFLPNLKVVFYNKLNNSFPLVQGTRLEYEGNVFKTLNRVVLEKGSEENPSQTLIEAVPFEIKNQNLNLPKGTKLKIVALEGKEYEKGKLWSDVLYAEVYEDYKPNIEKETKTVTPNDLTNLRLTLEKKIKDVLKGELVVLYPNKLYLDDDSLYSFEILNVSHKVGEKTNKISGLIQGKLETMVFSQNEVESLIKNIIFEKLAEEKEMFMINKLEITSISLIDYDFKQNLMKISVKGKVELTPNLSEEIIKNQIKGKTLKEITDYFSKIKGVKEANIKIWPAWRDRLPLDPTRIQILMR